MRKLLGTKYLTMLELILIYALPTAITAICVWGLIKEFRD